MYRLSSEHKAQFL